MTSGSTNLIGSDGGDFAFGTAALTAPTGTITQAGSTFVDLIAETSYDPISNATDAVNATDVAFDGSATAKDVYANVLIDDADVEEATTNTVGFTATIWSINLADD